MSADPRPLIAVAPMHPRQIGIVALCVALNMLDGFDVLAISFASPGIAAEWGINKAALGVVLSMELFGMAAGSILIGNIADRVGRRPVVLGCLLVMMLGMFGASAATSVPWLSIARLATGVGIGGMLSSTSALVVEFASTRKRGLAASLNIAGYSAGGIVGGLIAAKLLTGQGDWRWIFGAGGLMTAIALPLASVWLPESIEFLMVRRPANAIGRINVLLAKLGHPTIDTLPAPAIDAPRPSIASLFSRGYAGVTVLLTTAYFAQIMLFYYMLKWLPKIVVDLGFSAPQAARVLVAANVGNLMGAVAIGLAVQRWSARPMVIAAMVTGCFVVGILGLGFRDLILLSAIAGVATFFINAGVVGLYSIFAQAFPASLRATGTGFVIGLGRGGSALGPIVVGALFQRGEGLLTVSIAMGFGGLIAATALVLLPSALNRRAAVSGLN